MVNKVMTGEKGVYKIKVKFEVRVVENLDYIFLDQFYKGLSFFIIGVFRNDVIFYKIENVFQGLYNVIFTDVLRYIF